MTAIARATFLVRRGQVFLSGAVQNTAGAYTPGETIISGTLRQAPGRPPHSLLSADRERRQRRPRGHPLGRHDPDAPLLAVIGPAEHLPLARRGHVPHQRVTPRWRIRAVAALPVVFLEAQFEVLITAFVDLGPPAGPRPGARPQPGTARPGVVLAGLRRRSDAGRSVAADRATPRRHEPTDRRGTQAHRLRRRGVRHRGRRRARPSRADHRRPVPTRRRSLRAFTITTSRRLKAEVLVQVEQ